MDGRHNYGLTVEIKLRFQVSPASCGGLIVPQSFLHHLFRYQQYFMMNLKFATILLTRMKILQITGTNADM